MITFDNSGHLQQGLVRRAHQRSIKGTVQDRILVCIAQNQCVIFLRVRYYNLSTYPNFWNGFDNDALVCSRNTNGAQSNQEEEYQKRNFLSRGRQVEKNVFKI